MNTNKSHIFRDVSQAPAAVATATAIAPEWRKTLLDLGFVSVGVLESQYLHANIEQIQRDFTRADATFIIHHIEAATPHEIFASPDQSTVAMIEPYFGGPVLIMRTATDAGTGIETVTTPVRRPRVRWWRWLDLWLFIMPHLWMLPSYPGGHYHVTLVKQRDPAAVWQQHQKQISRWAPQTALRPHTDIKLYVALSQRAYQIQAHDDTMRRRFVSITFLVAVCVMLMPILAYVQYLVESYAVFINTFYAFPLFLLVYIFSFTVPVLLVVALQVPLTWISTRVVIPYFTGPRRQPVDELLQQVTLET